MKPWAEHSGKIFVCEHMYTWFSFLGMAEMQ